MRKTYSYIGNLADFLINNEQRIKNLMLEYEIQSKIDTLPDGRDVKSLLFTKHNVSVRFTPVRIDFTYAYTRPDSVDDSFAAAKNFFNLFSEIFYDILGHRIAIVSQSFIKNNNDEAIHEFTQKMGFQSAFGTCNELNFKINCPKTLFEPINSVINIDMGEAKNNKTQEKMKVLLVSIDVNTLASNQRPRFNPSDFDLDFKELLEEVQVQENKLALY